ncbi:Intracellular serine protease [compost metagenome]
MQRYAVLHYAGMSQKSFGPGIRGMGGSLPRLAVERLPQPAVMDLQRDPQVQAVTPTMPTCLIRPTSVTSATPGDNWGLGAVAASTSHRTGAGVTVAVLDTGIDRTHPAFGGVELVERDFSGDGNGDEHGHGTHCAGTVFGRDVDGVRIGVARGVDRALIGKVLRDDGSGESDMVFEAMTWALQSRAQIVSMSLGFDFPGMVERMIEDGWPVAMATSNALEAYRGNLRMFDALMGVFQAQQPFGGTPLVVAASGNESRRDERADFKIAASLPSAAVGVLAIGAVGVANERYDIASFSNTSPALVAPGVDIVSARSGGGLTAMSGTSMACPHAAGVAALWWQQLAETGGRPTAGSVSAKLLSNARTDVFVDGVGIDDRGDGLITCPA